jgi:hypothetical protein
VGKSDEEERAMKLPIKNKSDKSFAPWTALLILIVFLLFAPFAVLADNYELSQECAVAVVGSEHTVTATVTDDSGNPLSGLWVYFFVHGQNSADSLWMQTDETGVVQHTYTGTGAAGDDTIELIDSSWLTVAQTVVTWTDDPQDPALLACAGSSSQSVVVGGRVILNAKKRGALTIALCSDDRLDVTTVDLKSVQLVGVAPWHSKKKDSRLCPGGKDGVEDLVLKFKNREVVEALEASRGELEDADVVDLAITCSLNDGTVLDGVWQAEIKKKGKRPWKKKLKKVKRHKLKKLKKCKLRNK